MNDFEKISNNISISEKQINEIIKGIFDRKEIQEFVLSLNTEDQLYGKGTGADGKKLVPAYSPKYLKKKQKKGLPSHVSLYYNGKYLKSWKVRTFDDYFFLGSDPVILSRSFDLHDWLKRRYGINIEGLTEENMKKLREKVTPIFYEEYAKKLLQ